MGGLIVKPESAIHAADQTFALLSAAVEKGTSPEALEKLVALQERILARNAEGEFSAAMAEFQAQCPCIAKHHAVKDRGGRLLYKFAPLADIVGQVKGLLVQLGFSYSFDTQPDERGGMTVTCKIRHRAGHTEKNSVHVPATKGQNTNASQDTGIMAQYGMRYAFIGALGIVTADEDTDARVQGAKPISAEQAADLAALCEEVGADEKAFLKWMNAESFESIAQDRYDVAVSGLESKRRNAK